MENAKKQSNVGQKFKSGAKKVGGAMKNGAKKVGGKIKVGAKKVKAKGVAYKRTLGDSYNGGYATGWNDRDNIPNTIGATMFATIGYSRGLAAKGRYNKAQKRLAKAKQRKE